MSMSRFAILRTYEQLSFSNNEGHSGQSRLKSVTTGLNLVVEMEHTPPAEALLKLVLKAECLVSNDLWQVELLRPQSSEYRFFCAILLFGLKPN